MNKKVIFADLDGTLIKTVSGSRLPKGVWDMKIRYEVLDAIKSCNPKHLIVISNQGGIDAGFVIEDNFKTKINYLKSAFEEYLGINVLFEYCKSLNPNDEFRKPNVGMLEKSYHNLMVKNKEVYHNWEMLMIGDASGKPGQFSDSDYKTAKNFDIDYFDVDDFVAFCNKSKVVTKSVCDSCGYDACLGNDLKCRKYIDDKKQGFRINLSKNGVINESNPYVDLFFENIWDALIKAFNN